MPQAGPARPRVSNVRNGEGEGGSRAPRLRQPGGGMDEELTRWWQTCRGPVQLFFRRRGLSEHDAADLTQDVALEVCRTKAEFVDAEHFSRWCFTVARNRLYNSVRKLARGKEVESDVGQGAAASAEEEALGVIACQTAEMAVRALGPVAREALFAPRASFSDRQAQLMMASRRRVARRNLSSLRWFLEHQDGEPVSLTPSAARTKRPLAGLDHQPLT